MATIVELLVQAQAEDLSGCEVLVTTYFNGTGSQRDPQFVNSIRIFFLTKNGY